MTAGKPRVALMLSGLPRHWRQCLPSQMGLLHDYPHDIFFHFWDTVDGKEKTEIVDFLKPRAYRFEPPRDFSHLDSDPSITPDLINAPSRIASQHYSWRETGKLVEPFKNDYDAGIRSRADLQFVYSLDHIIPRLNPNDLVLEWWQENAIYADIFAVGGIDPILYYHTLYDHEMRYAPAHDFNPEILLTVHLQERPDIKVAIEANQLFFVRRPHMANYTNEQAMRENPGRNRWLDPEIVKTHADYHQSKKGEEGAAYVKRFQTSQLLMMISELREKIDPTQT